MKIKIDPNSGETKYQQLVKELIRVINTQYNKGDVLPSVNVLSKQLNISRDTVFKAYTELKNQKIVDATPTKGYFVSNEMNKVLLLLDYYSPFKDLFYRELERSLDSSWGIDLVFHHYNKNMFDLVVLESAGRYNYYIVMNFDSQDFEFSESLKKILSSKLLLIDIPVEKWKGIDSSKYNYIWQNFDESVYSALTEISQQIEKYKTFKLVFTKQLQHPAITLNAFKKFCNDINRNPQIITDIEQINIKKGDSFFVLRQTDLYRILSLCRDNNYQVGIDVGVVAFNDIPLYEFVSCGITVISTNFKEMGKKTAEFVTTGKAIREIIPTKSIVRKSL